MSITVTTQPRTVISGVAPALYSYWNRAYNPYTFVFTFSGIPSGATSLKVVIRIKDKAGTLVGTMEAYAFNNVATADVSRIIQAMITDQSAYPGAVGYYNDPSLYAGFTLEYDESYYTSAGVLTVTSYEPLTKYFGTRAVIQIPGDPNYYDAAGSPIIYKTGSRRSATGLMLTAFTDRKVRVWSGYPNDVSFILAEFSDTVTFRRYLDAVTTDTTVTQDGTYPGFIARVKLSNNLGNTYPYDSFKIVSGGVDCSLLYTVDVRTAGTNPFYVRWLNPNGGYDYWLFEKRQEVKSGSSNTKLSKRDITNFPIARSTHKVYRREGVIGWTCGATNLNQAEYNALSTIKHSPRVEYFNGTYWIEVIPEDTETSYLTDAPAGEVEYNFLMPEMLIQY